MHKQNKSTRKYRAELAEYEVAKQVSHRTRSQLRHVLFISRPGTRELSSRLQGVIHSWPCRCLKLVILKIWKHVSPAGVHRSTGSGMRVFALIALDAVCGAVRKPGMGDQMLIYKMFTFVLASHVALQPDTRVAETCGIRRDPPTLNASSQRVRAEVAIHPRETIYDFTIYYGAIETTTEDSETPFGRRTQLCQI